MPRCAYHKTKFTAKYFNQKYCLSDDECIKAFNEYVKKEKLKQDKRNWKVQKKEISIIVKPGVYKNLLQVQINLLARKIDAKFGFLTCIDCSKPFGKQCDGGHFKSVGANATLRYNLHNIHSQKSDCNQNGLGGGKQLGYYRGLIKRYGQEYADLVDTGIQIKYPVIKLTPQQVYEKLTLLRGINRNFDTYVLEDSLQARTLFNNLIGIYL